jgi:hypothetical protein
MSSESSHELLPDRPLRHHFVEYLLVAYFVAVMVAPLSLPPVVAADSATTYATAFLQVLGVTFVGYLTGLLILLWAMDIPN